MRSLPFILIAALGCSGPPQYTPPADPTKTSEMVVMLNQDFEETWQRLIEMLTSSFYSIDLLDKDSGFIRLDFTAADPDDYIDCGRVDTRPTMSMLSGSPGFVGSYASYLQQAYDLTLRARVNVHVKALTEDRTAVRVHARYLYGSYVFETGGEHTRRVTLGNLGTADRTCRPTHVAEGTILAATGADNW